MKAIVQHKYDSADVLRYTDIADPALGERDVLVQVRASSVNFGDRVSLHGEPRVVRLAFGLRRPKWTVLGRDVAGVVTAAGPKVTRFAVGDLVLGYNEHRPHQGRQQLPPAAGTPPLPITDLEAVDRVRSQAGAVPRRA